MMVFVVGPSPKDIYLALDVPRDIAAEEEFVRRAMNFLARGDEGWSLVHPARDERAVFDAPLRIEIEKPWGTVQALPGDFVLRDHKGDLSVVPAGMARSMGLKAFDFGLSALLR